MNTCSRAAIARPRRAVPTPGSTTATWIVAAGKHGAAASSASAPPSTSWGAISWVMSTMWTSRAMERIAAFISATYVSRVPKSVVSVMTATSPIAVDDEVRDQGERVPLLRRRERFEVGLRRPRVLVGPGQRVLDTLVVHHEPANLLDLLGVEAGALEEALDARRLGRRRPLEHGDERQRPLPLAEVGADRLAQPVLIGHEVERVVRDLESDADVEAVPREGVELRGRKPAQERADPTARGDERGRLLRDDPEVVRLRRDAAPLELQLEDFRLGHGDRRARERLHHGPVVVPHQHRERLRVEVVADEHGRVVTPLRVGRRPTAPQRRLVDDVVVDERRGVEQLNDAAEAYAARPVVPGQARRQQ